MTTTRGSALTHIVNELFGAKGDPNHPASLFTTKCGFTGPSEIMMMMIESDDIDNLELKDSNGVNVDIPLGLKKRILAMEYV